MKKSEKREKNNKKKWFVIAAVIGGAYLVSLFVPFVSPYTKYPFYFIKCGGPPIVATKFAAAYSATKPNHPLYQVTPFHDYFFCTEEEAREAGFNIRT